MTMQLFHGQVTTFRACSVPSNFHGGHSGMSETQHQPAPPERADLWAWGRLELQDFPSNLGTKGSVYLGSKLSTPSFRSPGQGKACLTGM